LDLAGGSTDVKGIVEEIYIAPEGSAAMERVEEVRTLEGCGIEGDRYCEGTGYYTPYGDVCEVTLIAAEDLDYIQTELGIRVKNGEHRRNIITRGIDLDSLRRRRFRVGEAVLQYDRPRPPCRHVQDLSEPGMTRALRGRGGICARVVEAGRIRPRDAIEVE
jgi:MOSC domain-containing protein YiiM